MKKKKNKKQTGLTMDAYVKAARKGSREAEIEQYGRPISYRKVFKSKKVYDRKNEKSLYRGDTDSFSLK